MFEYLLKSQFHKNIIGYENICKITNNIYQGNNKGREYINHFNIKKVIEIGNKEEIKKYKQLPNNVDILRIEIDKNDKLIKFYDKIWSFLEYNYNKNILIHCNDGSISILLLMSYLISYKFYSYEDALNLIIKSKENNIDLNLMNEKYIDEVIELDKELEQFRSKTKNK